jgi:thiol-disulfide isomerase/thioredoxin
MNTNKLLIAAVLAGAIGAPIAGFFGDTKGQPTTSTGMRVPFLHGFSTGSSTNQSEIASLERASEWLNSPPLTAQALRGKVVLVNFWTYTCINWRRELPYVRAWAEKYKDQGLVVVGVHAPEFEFEKNVANVHWAVKDMKIDYPVAVDNDHIIWRGFRNQAWPALYFIDAQGRVRHQHFGEGSYDQSEMVIQALLREAGATGVSREPVSVQGRGLDAAADWGNLRSPENYVGSERTERFVSPGGLMPDRPRMYERPARLSLNEWALSGDWTVRKDASALNKPSGEDHLPLSRPRPSSRHGPVRAGSFRQIPRAGRRAGAGLCARRRRRRTGQRHSDRAAALSSHPAAGSDC